jgi:hypothetical protein
VLLPSHRLLLYFFVLPSHHNGQVLRSRLHSLGTCPHLTDGCWITRSIACLHDLLIGAQMLSSLKTRVMLALTALMMSSKRKSDDTLEEPLLADDVQAGDVGSAAKKPKGGKFSRKNQPTPKKKVAQPAVCVPASSPATSAAAVDGTRWGHPIQSGQTCGHNMCRHNGSGMLRVPYNRRKAILEATGMSPEMAAGEHARYMCPEHLTADAVPGGAAWAVHVLPAAQRATKHMLLSQLLRREQPRRNAQPLDRWQPHSHSTTLLPKSPS